MGFSRFCVWLNEARVEIGDSIIPLVPRTSSLSVLALSTKAHTHYGSGDSKTAKEKNEHACCSQPSFLYLLLAVLFLSCSYNHHSSVRPIHISHF